MVTGKKVPSRRRPVKYYLRANDVDRLSVEANAKHYIHKTAKDKNYKVTISNVNSTRTDAQNAVFWLFNNQLVTFHDDSYNSEYFHGWNKLLILLPLMRHHAEFERLREEGDFIARGILTMPTFEHKVRAAHDCVRSSDLWVKEGVWYINALKEYWLTKGIELTINNSDYWTAMGARP